MTLLRLQDLLSGKTVAKHYSLYKQTQWYSEEQIREFQMQKLLRLLNHCYNNVPYYQRIMRDLSLHPNDFRTPEDIVRLPILTKEMVIQNSKELTPDNIENIKGVKSSYTGGTTGGALLKRNDAATRSSIWGAYYRFYDWMGIKRSDGKIDLMAGYSLNPTKLSKRIASWLIDKTSNSYTFDTYAPMQENLDRLIELLGKRKIKLLRSYTQYLYTIASELRQRGYRYNIKSIMTTAEPLFPEHRVLFQEVFGAEVFDQYGCGEIGGIAFECDHHEGLHVTEERVILETGETGELIITDLDNLALPLIRYSNADEAEICQHKCGCGRKSKLIKQIRGRVIDYLTGPAGQTLHSSYLWKIIYETNIGPLRNLVKFQAVQNEVDKILLRIVAQRFTKEEENLLSRLLKEKLGSVDIEYKYEANIENSSSGKYRPVINNLLKRN